MKFSLASVSILCLIVLCLMDIYKSLSLLKLFRSANCLKKYAVVWEVSLLTFGLLAVLFTFDIFGTRYSVGFGYLCIRVLWAPLYYSVYFLMGKKRSKRLLCFSEILCSMLLLETIYIISWDSLGLVITFIVAGVAYILMVNSFWEVIDKWTT